MSLRGLSNAAMSLCFPRVSGDEPTWQARYPGNARFSPRERG